MMEKRKVEFFDLGHRDYQETWDLQEYLLKETVDLKIQNRKLNSTDIQPTTNRLLMVEHPHVYTLGKSGEEKNLLLDEKGLIEHQAKYYRINRGGDITYHGPGQLVCYPIFDLENFFTDIHRYLRFLEEAVIRTLAEFDIKGERYDGYTGVWIDVNGRNPRKICAMGVKSSRWVTMHGLALNVNTDLSYFDHIIPCGIDDKAVTSIKQELNTVIPMKEVRGYLRKHLSDVFDYNEQVLKELNA